jgi:hypothetical protein
MSATATEFVSSARPQPQAQLATELTADHPFLALTTNPIGCSVKPFEG